MACETQRDVVTDLADRLAEAENALAKRGMGNGRNRAVKRLRKDLDKAMKRLNTCEKDAAKHAAPAVPSDPYVVPSDPYVEQAVTPSTDTVTPEPTPGPDIPWVPVGITAAALVAAAFAATKL